MTDAGGRGTTCLQVSTVVHTAKKEPHMSTTSTLATEMPRSIKSYISMVEGRFPYGGDDQWLAATDIAQRALNCDASPEAEKRRGFICANYAIRLFAPKALAKAGLAVAASTLSGLLPVTDAATAKLARSAAWDASVNASAARFGGNEAASVAFSVVRSASEAAAFTAVKDSDSASAAACASAAHIAQVSHEDEIALLHALLDA